MDAPEEDLDIKLQKISGDLIADFDQSLGSFLCRQDGDGRSTVRLRVRSRETTRLISSLLDPFQELPQLLDPHLPRWLPLLGEALLEYLKTRRPSAQEPSTRSELLMPLSTAICKILYTFCKIRGEKVVVRFLSVETRHLEPLLSALEEAERKAETAPDLRSDTTDGISPGQWTWEERYVVLLWLSHLLLAPFDLATISSVDIEDEEVPTILGFQWPKQLPGITIRILPVAVKYLAWPGKERDAARTLLVRISSRRDMQQLGVLDALVQWALSSLQPKTGDPERTPYLYIGILSYLAGILILSADTSEMDKYITPIFYAVHGASTQDGPERSIISTSALTRKTCIKVLRSVTMLQLRSPERDMAGTELIETTIGYLLESLADNDTPVRLAASKALSIITLKLETDMASQVIEAVLESLNRNVFWVKNPLNPGTRTKDLSAIDPLEWHGLMLTLSHLLYRRSPPADNLADIVHALVMGLSFERRSASGGAIGSNVRDAACFGIWALARRYTTKELLAVPTAPLKGPNSTPTSVLQIIATELIVTACLDPAGNIRRGSSAALQELIGRHPDTVENGIWVVQTVDYHAVALRSRAIREVGLNATRLSRQYGEAISDALLGWRGVGDADASSRRVAGAAYGAITAELAKSSSNLVEQLDHSVMSSFSAIKSLQTRQVEELHGLLLALASVFDSLPLMVATKDTAEGARVPLTESLQTLVRRSIAGLQEILTGCTAKTYRRPELVAEGASRLVISFFPLIQAAVTVSNPSTSDLSQISLLPGPELISSCNASVFPKISSELEAGGILKVGPLVDLIGSAKSAVCNWLARPEQEVITAASEAGLVLLVCCEAKVRAEIIRGWANIARHRPSSRTETGAGYFAALTMSYPALSTLEVKVEDESIICDALLSRWASDKNIDTRVAILQGLAQSEVLRQNSDVFLDLLSDGLDDYTTNARGDVGSHVRLEAIRATRSLWSLIRLSSREDKRLQEVTAKLFLRILRLAVEKLDRVRVEAQACLSLALNESVAPQFSRMTFSSRQYFRFQLHSLFQDCLHPSISATAKSDPDRWMEEMMAGYVSSADTGNEDLVVASRAALCDFFLSAPSQRDAVCASLVRNLKVRQGQDCIIVPTLEVIAFLFHVGLFGACDSVDFRNLCLQVQKAGYKTGNVRKIEACIKVYGGVAAMGTSDPAPGAPAEHSRRAEGVREARKRLGALMFHPWPRVRSSVVDELWGLFGLADSGVDLMAGPDRDPARLTGMDWGKADKETIRALVEGLGLS